MGFSSTTRDKTYSYMTPYGAMPALQYVLAATCWDRSQPVEAVLLHWMTISGYLRRHSSVNNFADCSDEEKGNWFAEMATLWARALIYSVDYTRNADGKKHGSDQWNSVAAAPASALEAFDCEDGAAFILQLVRTVQGSQLTSSALNALQQWLASYTPFFVIGSIKTSKNSIEGYAGHAVCVLLDTHWVQCARDRVEFRPNSWSPAVVLESTVYTEGVWSASSVQWNDSAADEYYKHGDAILSSPLLQNRTNGGTSWRRVCKARAPVSTINDAKMYGTFTSLLTDDFRGQGPIHCVLQDLNAHRVSCNALDVLLYDPAVQLFAVGYKFLKEDVMLLRSEVPVLRLPEAPKDYDGKSFRLHPDNVHVTVRLVDYLLSEHGENELLNAARAQSSTQSVQVNKVMVTACTGMVVLNWHPML
jgi:hypothetical protein